MNRIRIVFCLSAALAFAPSAFADNSPAKPASTLDIIYQLNDGILPLGKVGMSSQLQGGGYKSHSTLETSGIINLFWRAKIDAQANGLVGGNRLRPESYDSHSLNHKNKTQQVSLSYRSDGLPILYANPPYRTDKYLVSDEQKKDTLDPVSAVVFMTAGLSVSDKSPCGAIAPVFDGARRYDVAIDYLRTRDVKMDNGLYTGPALVCQIHYRQIAGFKQKILSEGAKMPDIFAWVVPMPSRNDPARHYLVPVRVWAETEFGVVTANASHVKLDDRVLNAGN